MTFDPEYLQFAVFVVLFIVFVFYLPQLLSCARKNKRDEPMDGAHRMAYELIRNYHSMDRASIIDAFFCIHEQGGLPLIFKLQSGESLNDVMYFLANEVLLNKDEVEKMSQMPYWEEIRESFNIKFRFILMTGLTRYGYDFLLPVFVNCQSFLEQRLKNLCSETREFRHIYDREVPLVREYIARFATKQ